MSNWTSCTRTLRSRRDIENVDKQSVQLIVLVSMLPTVPGMLVLVEYSNDEIRPMVATALPALDWFSGRPACRVARMKACLGALRPPRWGESGARGDCAF